MNLPHPLRYALITNPVSIYYYTGLYPSHQEREAFLFVTPTQTLLYHSPFIKVPASAMSIPMSKTNNFHQVITTHFPPQTQIGIESENLTVAEQTRLQSIGSFTFQPLDDWLKNTRMIKKQNELTSIKKACRITKSTIKWLDHFLPTAAGITEIQLARLIEQYFFELGATGTAFPTIVAFDSHSALPHHTPTTRKLKSNSVVLIDFGAEYHHYKSDYTRTWCLGSNPPPLFTIIKNVVDEAYRNTYKQISPSLVKEGVRGCLTAMDLDNTARKIITQNGFGDKFIHTTGHGIGLDAHEPPSLNPQNPQELKSNMVITIEPGIYLPAGRHGLPGHFGYRYENTLIL